MLLIIKFVAKIISVLNGEISPREVAAGFAYGALIGLLPAAGLLPYLLLLLSFIININLAAVFLAAAIFKLLSFALDPLANWMGYFWLVHISALKSFWTALYNLPVVPYTKFNNTIVLGSLILGLLLLVPLYFLAKMAVINYRERYRERVLRFKIVQIIKASTFYRYYESFKGLRGE